MHEQICKWLDLPPGNWPPDHYTLLGLSRGESDPQVIELHIQERMQRIRPLQLSSPYEVTEAMNRLALAFSCLMDPTSRNAYDQSLRDPPLRKAIPTAAQENGSPDFAGPLAWLFGPWDRLAGEDSTLPSRFHHPHFHDWKKDAPPRRGKSRSGDENDRESDRLLRESATSLKGEHSWWWRLFWKYSNSLMIGLAVLALLLSFLRQWSR
jgi:hypothetical protein